MTYLKIILLFMSCTACSCQNFGQTRPSQYDQRQQQPQKPQAFYSGYNQNERVSKGVMELAINIAKQSMKKNSKNEIFSPISIAGALSLLLLGANKSTYDQLVNVLNLQGMQSIDIHTQFGKLIQDLTTNQISSQWPPTNWKIMDTCNEQDDEPSEIFGDDAHKISVTDGIFVQSGFALNQDYVNAAKSVYKSDIVNLDFQGNSYQATQFINNWVNTGTNGKIPEIISGALSPETKMVVASALYFKALWQETFIEGATQYKNFYPDGKNGEPIQTQLMAHGGCFPYYDDKSSGLRIMGFPYKKNQTTMYIILPNNSSRSKIQDTQRTISADIIENMISKMRYKQAVVLFPKMHVTNTMNLKNTLQRLGLNDLFNIEASDLSLVARNDGVSLSRPQNPTVRPQQSINQQPSRPSGGEGFSEARPAVNMPSYFSRPTEVPMRASSFDVDSSRFPEPSSLASSKYPILTTTRQPRPTTTKFEQFPGTQNGTGQGEGSFYFPMDLNVGYQIQELTTTTTTMTPRTQYPPQVGNRVGSNNFESQQTPFCNCGCNCGCSWCRIERRNCEGYGYYLCEQCFCFSNQRGKRDIKYKVESSSKNSSEPLNIKDLVLKKRIMKVNPGKKLHRSRRQAYGNPLYEIERLRRSNNLQNPRLFASQILHKIDLDINERGTEGGAATAISLDRIAPNTVFRVDTPFMILIRHDPTKLPLFFGSVFDPRA